AQPLGETLGFWNAIEIRDMPHLAGLLTKRRHQVRMSVAESVDGDACGNPGSARRWCHKAKRLPPAQKLCQRAHRRAKGEMSRRFVLQGLGNWASGSSRS